MNRLGHHVKLAATCLILVLTACAPTSMDPSSVNAILFGATALRVVVDAAAAENRAMQPQPVGTPTSGFSGGHRGANAAGCVSVANITTDRGNERVRFQNTCPYQVSIGYDYRHANGSVRAHIMHLSAASCGTDSGPFPIPCGDVKYHDGGQVVGPLLQCRGAGVDPTGRGDSLGGPWLPLVSDGWVCPTNPSGR